MASGPVPSKAAPIAMVVINFDFMVCSFRVLELDQAVPG
jgi:hypothetical protein